MDNIVLAAIVAAIASIISIILTSIINRRRYGAEISKDEAEAAQFVTDSALQLVKPLQCRIEKLERIISEQEAVSASLNHRLAILEGQRDELWRGATALTKQVIELKATPVYIPPLFSNHIGGKK